LCGQVTRAVRLVGCPKKLVRSPHPSQQGPTVVLGDAGILPGHVCSFRLLIRRASWVVPQSVNELHRASVFELPWIQSRGPVLSPGPLAVFRD
jgi:hypothetical protein